MKLQTKVWTRYFYRLVLNGKGVFRQRLISKFGVRLYYRLEKCK